jgi:hypothetical protein
MEHDEEDRLAAELRAGLIKVRDAKYPSKLARNGARLTALENAVLEMLKLGGSHEDRHQ